MGWKRKKFYPEACGTLAERNEKPWGGWAGVGVYRACRFGAQHLTTERSGLEISEAWGGEYQCRLSGSLWEKSETGQERSEKLMSGSS